MKRTAFFISDSTGITAETLGNSLLTQFPQFEFTKIAIPYVNNAEKAVEVLKQINQTCRDDQTKALVFSTLADTEIRNIVADCNGMFMDLFSILIGPLEEELNSKYAQKIGELHSIANLENYDRRIAAIEFALNTDDGIGINNYKDAEIIIVGVSRSGKSPVCLYLALKFGIFAANYPIVDTELEFKSLPTKLLEHKEKTIGLIISPERLHEIREQRQPNSSYAKIEQCKKELTAMETIFKNDNIPYINSTSLSIEEIATKIITIKKLTRQI